MRMRLTGGFVLACFALATQGSSSEPASSSDVNRAAFLYRRAVQCRESETTLKLFANHVETLTGSPPAKKHDMNPFIPKPEAEFLDGGPNCALWEAKGLIHTLKLESRCPTNPYAAIPCDVFLRQFRAMPVTRPAWRPSQGFH